MVFKGFVGQSYRTQSSRLSVDETVNLTLEINEMLKRRQFYRAPGLMRAWSNEIEAPVTAMALRSRFTVQEVWALIGDFIVYFHLELSPIVPGYAQVGTLVLVNSFGPIVADGNKATFAFSPNGAQVVVCTNDRAWMIENDVLTELTWFGVGVNKVALINNYFIFNSAEGDGFFFSEPGNANSGDPLNFRSAEASANTYLDLIVDRNVDIWLLGTQVTQIFYNDPGDPEEPFKPNRSAAMETGVAGANLSIAANNRVFWIDENSIVRASNGYNPDRVSTPAVESELRSYGDISDGFVWTATWNGHIVVRWTFPSPTVDLGRGKISVGMTWQYDATTDDWTRVLSWDAINGNFTAHRGMSSCEPIKGKQLVGDRENGAIYILTPEVQTDDCTRVPWFRRAPIINQEGLNVEYPWFELGMQVGVGRPLGDFSDPHCNVFPEDDGGEIVSVEFEAVAFNNAEESLFIDLKDTDGNTYASLEFPAGADGLRATAEIDPDDLPDDATYYPSFRAATLSAAQNFDCYEARLKINYEHSNGLKTPIWLEMVNAELFGDIFTNEYTAMGRRLVKADYEGDNLKIPVSMLTGFGSTGGGLDSSDLNNWWAYCDDVIGESYGPPSNFTDEDNGHTTIFVKDEAKYADLVEWELEVTAAAATSVSTTVYPMVNDGSQTGYAALFNKTTGQMVAGSEIEFTDPDVTTQTVTIANDATNFTDGDEFWVQYKTTDSTYIFTLYNVFLYAKLTTPTKARVPLRVSNALLGGGLGTAFNTSVRSLFDADDFTEDSTYTVETSARVTAGSGVDIFLFDVGLSDEGAQTVTRNATVGSTVTGSWFVPENLVDPSVPPANIELTVSSDTATLEAGDFGFDGGFPADAQIRTVTMNVGYGMLGQATASFRGYARISGVDENFHTESVDESEVAGANPSPPPDDLVIMRTLTLNLSADRSWIIDDFSDANFVARVQARQPANTTPTIYFVGGSIPGVQMIVGYGTDVADSDVTPDEPTQELYVSDPITLTDQTRYAMHATSDGSNQTSQSDSFLYAEMEVDGGGGGGEIPPDLQEQPEFDPEIYLVYSNNWGQSYSAERYRSIGKSGEYDKRVYWARNGTGRQRVFEVGGSSACPICIDEAYLGEPEALKS